MIFNWNRFGGDQPITKGTLREGHSTFSAVSHIPVERCFSNSTSITHCACPKIETSLLWIC